uniref:ESPR-type extended signal peptide-containing protein n=1 Tax=Vreelandella olivaria TaxID=390919 RepID=UPI00201E9478
MNRCYRTAWNHRKGVWQAISERGTASRARGCLCRLTMGTVPSAVAAAGILLITPNAYAELPSGGTVVAGDAALSQHNHTLTIDQSSQNAAI